MYRFINCLCFALLGSAYHASGASETVTDIKMRTVTASHLEEGGQLDARSNLIAPLSSEGRRNVSMSCKTFENGHRLKITVNNANPQSRTCSSMCFFTNSRGETGSHSCSGTVIGNYSGEFCTIYSSEFTYTVTSPGAFDCD